MSSPEPQSPPVEAPASGLQLDCAQASHPGRDPSKQVNEDSAGYAETRHGHLFVVCDGMGGHAGGQQASQMAIHTIFEMVGIPSGRRAGREVLKDAIEEAARRVYRLGGPASNIYRPGSTCVSLLLQENRAETAHVGDSRAYAIRGQRIFRITRDHSLVQDLIDSGALSEQQAIGHPDANKITRALGMLPEVDVELRPDPMEIFADDIFLLATDGLSDLVPAEDILSVTLATIPSGAQAVCDKLVDLANERGGHDNITVQVVRVRSTGPLRRLTLPGGPSGLAGGGGLGPSPEVGLEAGSAGAEGTVPDAGPTLVDAPRAPVATTAPDVGAPSPTIVQEPAERLPITAPDRPAPTVVDQSLSSVAVAPTPSKAPPPAAVEVDDEDTRWYTAEGLRNSPLLYVVLVMAVIIGALAVALLWMALGR